MTGPDSFLVQRMGAEDGPFTARRSCRPRPERDAQVDDARQAGRWDRHVVPGGGDPGVFSHKDWLTATLLSLFVGCLAIDRFYLGYTGLGVLEASDGAPRLGSSGRWST